MGKEAGKPWGAFPALSPAAVFQKRLETQHVRVSNINIGHSYWKMKTTTKTGTSEQFFPEGKNDLGKEKRKRMEEPVHDSFYIIG